MDSFEYIKSNGDIFWYFVLYDSEDEIIENEEEELDFNRRLIIGYESGYFWNS